MADNVTLPGTSSVVSSDDIGGGVQAQNVKLMDGTGGSSTPIPGDSTGLWVRPRPFSVWTQVTSGGLTTASTSYAIGDQVGTIFTFAGSALANGGTGTIVSAVLLDKADVIVDMNLHVFKASPTLASDNAAFSVSDSDMENYLGTIRMPTALDLGANRLTSAGGVVLGYSCAATSIFVALETRTAHTFFAATTDLWLALKLDLD